ncbi:MAG: hydrogenase iron-sulfur subunit [Spartobacteria bacterium]|nr:hydrogenase iron-sulfur subunit [Spartobacteria bacterium]
MEKFIASCEKSYDVVLLCCRRCLLNAEELTEAVERETALSIKPFILPCSSRVHPSHLLRLLERGAKAIEFVACLETNCQLLLGSRRVERRVQYVQDLLTEINENPERLGLTRRQSITPAELVELAKERLAKSRDVFTLEVKDADSV